jgi:ATP-dependent RNA helicase DeaD
MKQETSKNDNLNFEDMGLSNEIRKAVADLGFEEPTPIQSRSIPLLMKGKDLIGQAQTGTGKTAAYGIPIVEKIDIHEKHIQSIILCPTRELALQVAEDIVHISKHKKNLRVLPVYGGQSIEIQINALKTGVHILIGTPGRILDHLDRGTLKLNNIKSVVLDEADEMLNMGFRDDIESILKNTPEHKQTIMFSATMSNPILTLMHKYLDHPEKIVIAHKTLTIPSTEQIYFELREKDKADVLCNLIDIHQPKLSLIFCNTKIGVDRLVEKLNARGYFAEGLHGNLKQSQRERVMSKFRKGKLNLLIATDVAARGLDVEDIDIVFNYDMPQNEEYYVHRIGRTGRMGKTGSAFSFVTGKEINSIKEIRKFTNAHIVRKDIPSEVDIKEIKSNNFLNRVKQTIDSEQLSEYIHKIEYLLSEDYTTLDLAAAMLKIHLESNDLNGTSMQQDVRTKRNGFNDFSSIQKNGMVRLFLNIGNKHKLTPGDILNVICTESSIDKSDIGRIDILENFTFFDIRSDIVESVIPALKDVHYKGRKFNVEIAKENFGRRSN